jgi:hypothetical protein
VSRGMSSDTFYIEVSAISGDTVELVCRTGSAGGLSDYADTRSFVLSALYDGLPYGGKLPLQRALGALGAVKIWEEAFHREHVGKFIASVELVSRHGIIDNERAWFAGRQSLDDDEAERDYPYHRFVLRARVTDPQWLKGQKIGKRFGTTAFDAWFKDPQSPTSHQRKAVEAAASHWRPPSEVTPGAAKKSAAKKSAAKKAAATKSAAKAPAPKSVAKKAPATKSAATKSVATKAAATKSVAKKAAATKAPATKSAATKSVAPGDEGAGHEERGDEGSGEEERGEEGSGEERGEKAPATKAAAKKSAAKKAPATKAAAKRAPATKVAAKKAATKKAAAKKSSSR